MKKLTLSLALLIYTTTGFVVSAAQPAPAAKGLAENAETEGAKKEETTAKKVAETGEDTTTLNEQIAALQTELKSLQTMLDKFAETQKELERLRGRVAITEGDHTAIRDQVTALKTEKEELTTRIKTLEDDNAALRKEVQSLTDKMAAADTGSQQHLTAKPAFVKAAVRFFNHEGRSLKMNVNGVWHTLKDGENMVWVPYGPVHIYRYNGAEPRTFSSWKPYMDGYVMEFDVGKP